MSNVLKFPERFHEQPPEEPQALAETPKRPQVEDGYTRIANELLVAMARARLKSTEYPIVLFIARETYGWNVKHKIVRVDFMARELGMASTKVSEAVAELLRRKVLYRVGDSQGPLGINKHYDQWLKKTGASKTVNRANTKTREVHGKREGVVHEKRESNKDMKDIPPLPSVEGEGASPETGQKPNDEKPQPKAKPKGGTKPKAAKLDLSQLPADVSREAVEGFIEHREAKTP